MIVTGTGGLGNKRTKRDHPNNSIVVISQNTKKSPVDLKKLAVTLIPLSNYQLMRAWRTLKIPKLYYTDPKLKGTKKKLVLFQRWPLDWKHLLSPVPDGKTTRPLGSMLAHSLTSNSRLCYIYIKSTKRDLSPTTKNTEFGHIYPKMSSI